MNEKNQKGQKKKKRRLLGCLIILGIVLLFFAVFFLGGITLLTAALFDKTPLKQKAIPINNQALMQATWKLQQVVAEMQNCPPKETRTVSFNEQEVNAIISLTESAQIFLAMFSIAKIDPQELQKIKDYKLRYREGKFILHYSKKMNFTTPFGAYLNAKAVFTPYIEGTRRSMEIDSLQLGALPVPKGIASAEIDYFINIAETDEEYERCLSVIDAFQIDTDNNVVIRYYPARLKELLQEFMNKK